MRAMASVESRTVDFWANVEKSDGCWNWTRAISAAGYGVFWWLGKIRLTHRLSYEMAVGKIPDGLVLDHLCRNPKCCNPSHLEAVPQVTNVRRGEGITNAKRSQTHCIHGHSLEDALVKPGNRRDCRECNRIRCTEYRKKRGN